MYNILDSLDDDNEGKSRKRSEEKIDKEPRLKVLPERPEETDHDEFFNFRSSPILSSQNKRVKAAGAKVEKRYRLGLYDCISSYCGSLKGESRKTCIVNFCHRQSQIEE